MMHVLNRVFRFGEIRVFAGVAAISAESSWSLNIGSTIQNPVYEGVNTREGSQIYTCPIISIMLNRILKRWESGSYGPIPSIGRLQPLDSCAYPSPYHTIFQQLILVSVPHKIFPEKFLGVST
jgi:hypothetical protein